MLSSRQIIPSIGISTGQGADCTLDGMTLAGVPLLQRTINGFAPRPADEIGKLLSSAYGFEFNPTKIQPRLAVVADALNRGEVARAMVATAQIALPELNPEAASRLAKAHVALVKYDPSEPRDERGRWTFADDIGGGGGGSDASDAGTGGAHVMPASNYEPANDNIPKAIRDKFEETLRDPRIINHMFLNECISNIRGGDYYDKTQECASANRDCEYLVKLGERNFKREDICLYPDGGMLLARGGFIIPLKLGHKW
ncbi:hypothetical protein [Phenylobacterium montanum]|uniref:Uncharacterized protein n=1 Tax=Phenylobacterium montanum TaxID=2823693 RepID=A0A975IY57_9CAUL|nr:hypothetical protein [Caulobacter sp. S6]QUD90106.1 hypothetical protein KCG34_09680 [Caulobacter sp. S6]